MVKSETVKDEVAREAIGDVWQFLGFDEAEGSELDLTAQLLLQVQRLIKGKKQLSVAKLLGTTQPRVSDLKRGNIDKFSASALHGFLQKLDPEARYVITRVPRERRSGTDRRSGERKRRSA
jgi:predicted XRE-type DNA-binding protein